MQPWRFSKDEKEMEAVEKKKKLAEKIKSDQKNHNYLPKICSCVVNCSLPKFPVFLVTSE